MKSVSLVIALYVERTLMLNGSFYRLLFSSFLVLLQLLWKPTMPNPQSDREPNQIIAKMFGNSKIQNSKRFCDDFLIEGKRQNPNRTGNPTK